MTENYYLGVDVGTGSVRVCAIDHSGEIKGLVVKDIQTWNPKPDYYVGNLRILKRLRACNNLTEPNLVGYLSIGTIYGQYMECNILLHKRGCKASRY